MLRPLTPSTTTSPDSRVVICGSPQAAASQVVLAQPSHCDGKTCTVAAGNDPPRVCVLPTTRTLSPAEPVAGNGSISSWTMPDQHQFRVREVEPVPRFEQQVDAFALDQRADKQRAEQRRRLAGCETPGVRAFIGVEDALGRKTFRKKDSVA